MNLDNKGCCKMSNKYDWGIYNGVGGNYDFKDKERNVHYIISYMLNRTLQMFEYKNLPDSLPTREMERLIQVNGFTFITEVGGELYAFNGGLGGEQDVYGKPTNITISNPALRYNETLNIEEDGVLIRNDDMGVGLIPILSRYGTLLNENELTMYLATVGKRITNLISVSDDNTAESARQYLKNVEDGNLGFIMENRLYESLKSKNVGDNGSVRLTDLIELQQYTKASLFNEIGLNSNFNMKKERLISEEVEINSNSIFPLVDNMLQNRKDAVERINEKYGTNISVEFSSSWRYIDTMVDKSIEEELSENSDLEGVENKLDEVIDNDNNDVDICEETTGGDRKDTDEDVGELEETTKEGVVEENGEKEEDEE